MDKKINILISGFARKSVIFPLVFLATIIVGVAMYWLAQQNKWLNTDYLRQNEIVKYEENLQDILYYVQRAESDVRGYIISHNKDFVLDFKEIIDSVNSNKNQLEIEDKKLSLAFNPELVTQYNRLLKEKMAMLSEAKLLGDEGKWDEAVFLVNSEKGKYLSDSIYAVIQTKNNEIRTFTQQANIKFINIKKSNSNLSLAATGVAVLLLILIVFFLRKQVQLNGNLSAEISLQKEFFKTTVESLGEGLIATNKKGEIAFMNPAAERLTGWNFSEAKHQPLSTVYRVYNEETGLLFNNVVNRILDAGKAVELENNTLLKSKQDEYLVISNNGAPLKDEAGNITGAVLVFNDISEKKKNEDELRQNESQFRNLIENLPEAVYTCDELGYIQLYNKAAVKLWGREPLAGKELWAGSWKILNLDGTEIPPEICPMATAIKERRQVLGKEILIQRPDGSTRHVLPSPTPLFNNEGKITGAVNMLLDVTDKKEREILIKKTEEKYRNLFEQGNDAIVTYSFDGTIHEFNDIICTMSGYTREEFAKFKLQDILVGDMILSTEKYNAILAGEMVTILRQCRKKNGTAADLEFKTKMNSEGIVVGFGRDITERNRNEEKLRSAIERFEILSRATSDTIWDWNIKEDSITYNRGITKTFGYSLAQIKSRADWWKENTHTDDNIVVDNQMAELFKTQGQNIQMEYRYRCADGSYKHIKDRAFVIYDAEGNPVRMVGAMQDLTNEKNHEREIAMTVIETQESERRELGMELHDNVNQLLSATLLYLGMAVKGEKTAAEISGTLKDCMNYINVAITDIRNLSHRLTPQTSETIPLKEVIEWCIEALNKTGKLEINLEVDKRADELIAEDIKTNFYRIIQEQLHNIQKHAKATKVDIKVEVLENKFCLSIEDDGIGFDQDLKKAGIGLQNIKRRAEIFFGTFSLETAPGKGCRISIEQPFTTKA